MAVTKEDVMNHLTALDDVVKAAKGAMDALKSAADYLRSHGAPDLTDIAEKIDAIKDDLKDKVSAVAASGGAAE